MKQCTRNYKRIVVKFGSSLFYSSKEGLDFSVFKNIASSIVKLVEDGFEVVVVSSGAITLGANLLGLKARPKELSELQAVAAIGQNELMNVYRKAFEDTGCFGAQILLTWEDFTDRKRYLNAKNTLLALLELRNYHAQRAVPIVNENDTVSTEEIKFGDNDRLSALVASLISADLLIILSDVDGLLDREKRVVSLVGEITPAIKSLACPTKKKTCVGGMITKLEAAKIAVDSGVPCVIANGHKKDIILSVIENPQDSGTLFIPKGSCLKARDRWIAFGSKPKGKIMVDDGARVALVTHKKSLLSVGIIALDGEFESGDVVGICDKEGVEFARGKVNISRKELERKKGVRSDKEAVHRNDIVISK